MPFSKEVTVEQMTVRRKIPLNEDQSFTINYGEAVDIVVLIGMADTILSGSGFDATTKQQLLDLRTRLKSQLDASINSSV